VITLISKVKGVEWKKASEIAEELIQSWKRPKKQTQGYRRRKGPPGAAVFKRQRQEQHEREVMKAMKLFIIQGSGMGIVDSLNEDLKAVGVDSAIAISSRREAGNSFLWKGFTQHCPDIEKKEFRIFPNLDWKGIGRAQLISAVILKAYPSADVRIVEEFGFDDFEDWYNEMKSNGNDVSAIIKELLELCEKTEKVIPEDVAEYAQNIPPIKEALPMLLTEAEEEDDWDWDMEVKWDKTKEHKFKFY
jgi:hypothetical protein